MHCELLVPGLFSGNAEGRFGALELLLARARRRHGAARTVEAWLQEAFELGDAPFPAGALTLLADGGDAGDSIWTRADPAHLRVMRDHVVAAPADALTLSQAEADALCDALARHFAGQLEVQACEPKSWCARLPADAPPGDALLNEAQMLLHAHPVNEAREARGELPINSLRLWGAGRAPRSAHCRWQSVAADDPAVRGAARLAGARHRPLPVSAQEWLDRLPEDGCHLALLDARQTPLTELEQRWFAPLLGALRAGRAGMVTLHVPDGAEEVSFETIRGDLRRFWRRAKPLEHYA
ncbi:MAG TPA: hypothetical protein VFU24_04940 [Burkholderiales bacterium]|nr:hypothetical protein [Burkholderiales bacterium]